MTTNTPSKDRYGIWKCPMCNWQGELKQSECVKYHDRFHSKQGTECVCLDFDLVIDLSPDTPSSRDEEIPTPRTNARTFNIPPSPQSITGEVVHAEFAEELERELFRLSAEGEKEREIYRLALGYQSKGDFESADKILATLNK